MKYSICARWWNPDLETSFGKEHSIHELSENDVILSIIKFGRAEITNLSEDLRQLNFQNDYD